MRRSLGPLVFCAFSFGLIGLADGQGVLPPSPSEPATPPAMALPPSATSPEPTVPMLPAEPGASGAAPLSIDKAARPAAPPSAAQNTAPAPGMVPLDGYVMSGMIRALVARDLDAIPDHKPARQYIVSLVKAMNETCGERAANVALRAMEYVDPRAGRAMRGDAEAGMQIMTDLLKGLAGGVPGMVAQAEQSSVLLKEGVEDGRLFIGRHTCFSTEFRRFEASVEAVVGQRAGRPMAQEDPLQWAALMSPEFRSLMKIPDPTEAMKRRELDRMSAGALKACIGTFDSGEPFCRCAVDKLKTHELASADWQALGTNFFKVAEVKTDRVRLRRDLQACDK